ncbi:hypothetical protein DRQ25_13290 [Candidatus Fermentibacteria bacterium]|nr:MAG: hypothetical protein DRQ25_13290 [Candidatus Fermentibacteria bacterium]
MLRRPGYLRIYASVFRYMTEWALRRQFFLWILLAAPLIAWILPGQTSVPFLPLAISCITYCGPAAFIAGWRCSSARDSLADILFSTKAGKHSLILPEILLPMLAGALPALGLAILWTADRGGFPWQLWVVIPFASLTAVSITVLLEKYLNQTGYLLNTLAFMAQASTASWVLSPVFQLMIPHGYVLWTLRWIDGSGAAYHGDMYVFAAVIQGIGLILLTVRVLSDSGMNHSGLSHGFNKPLS